MKRNLQFAWCHGGELDERGPCSFSYDFNAAISRSLCETVSFSCSMRSIFMSSCFFKFSNSSFYSSPSSSSGLLLRITDEWQCVVEDASRTAPMLSASVSFVRLQKPELLPDDVPVLFPCAFFTSLRYNFRH